MHFPSGGYPACTSSIRLVLTSGLQPIRSVQFAGWTLRPSWLRTADVFCSVGEKVCHFFLVPFWVRCQMSVSPSPLTFDLAFWANSKRESLIHVGLTVDSKGSKMERSLRLHGEERSDLCECPGQVSVWLFAESVIKMVPIKVPCMDIQCV